MSLFNFAVVGVAAVLKRLLGDAKPTELAHVDMNARLELNGLMHYVDCPQLWPPTLAVCLVYLLSLAAVGFHGRYVNWPPRSTSWKPAGKKSRMWRLI